MLTSITSIDELRQYVSTHDITSTWWAYCRQPPDAGSLHTIEEQRLAIMHFCARKDLSVEPVFVEEIADASKPLVPAPGIGDMGVHPRPLLLFLLHMLKEVAVASRFDCANEKPAVVCVSMDKLSELPVEQEIIMEILRISTVCIYFVNPLRESPSVINTTDVLRRPVRQALHAFRHYFSDPKNPSGFLNTALMHNFVGGRAPYGFSAVNGKLVIKEKEAVVIRFIFEKICDGLTYGDIVKLTKERFPYFKGDVPYVCNLKQRALLYRGYYRNRFGTLSHDPAIIIIPEEHTPPHAGVPRKRP